LQPNLAVTEVDKHLLSGMPSYPGNFIDFIGFGFNDLMECVVVVDDKEKM
jgi:hypothetical protein